MSGDPSRQDDLDEAGAVALAVEALVAAAEEDAATGGAGEED